MSFVVAVSSAGASGCASPATSGAPKIAAVSLARSPSGGGSFDFCSKPTGPVHLGNAAWLAFFSANEYSHARVVAPMLVDLGFENPASPRDRAWPTCLDDLDRLRGVQSQRGPELSKALADGSLRALSLDIVRGADGWGGCARPFIDSDRFDGKTFPAASLQRYLVNEVHDASFLEFFSAGKIEGSSRFVDASTQALVARHRDLPVVIVAFRGTEPDRWEDVHVDLKTWKAKLADKGWPEAWGSVHSGILDAFLTLEPLLMKKLQELRGNASIWITGHSLGGALATLMTARLLAEMEEGEAYDVGGLYTFGSPRVGDDQFAAAFGAAAERHGVPVVRFRNGNDMITALPGKAFGYAHVGTLAHLTEGGVVVGPPEDPPYAVLSPADHDIAGMTTTGTPVSGYYRRLLALHEDRKDPSLDHCSEDAGRR